MNQENNEQTELLRNIWNEMKAMHQSLGSRIDKTNERLEAVRVELKTELKSEISGLRTELKSELSGLRSELISRMTDSEVRLATATNELATTVRSLSSIVGEWRKEHRASVNQMEKRVQNLEEWREQVEANQP